MGSKAETRMKIHLRDIKNFPSPPRAIVYSLDQSVYQVFIETTSGEAILLDNNGRVFRRRNLQAVREDLKTFAISGLLLRQHSAYDEMINQPLREQGNMLELPLSLADQQDPDLTVGQHGRE